MLGIAAGSARCDILPTIGGSLAGWSVEGQEMFRWATDSAIADRNPLGMASFPLVPYSNRIANARFEWRGEIIGLRPNFAPEVHAIHGVGWTRPWAVTTHELDRATIVYRHGGDADWPWPFLAEQQITITERELRLVLTARNLADIPVPLAFGHHPYFDSQGADLRFEAEQVWLSSADVLPIEPVTPIGKLDFSAGAPTARRGIDNCYANAKKPAHISWAGQPLRLEISSFDSLPDAVLYSPPDQDLFCFEPVPHINNALNLGDATEGMPVLSPDDVFQAEIIFTAVPNT